MVLIIHEIFGLSDWIRSVADRSRRRFIAVAPDLISGLGREAAARLGREPRRRGEAGAHADARGDRPGRTRCGPRRPRCRRRTASSPPWVSAGAVARSFSTAAQPHRPDAAVVFYGVSPDSAALPSGLKAPVLGHDGGRRRARRCHDPARPGGAQEAPNRFYEPHLDRRRGPRLPARARSLRGGANYKATQQAWPRTIEFLRDRLK